jgi:hypothetical protein
LSSRLIHSGGLATMVSGVLLVMAPSSTVLSGWFSLWELDIWCLSLDYMSYSWLHCSSCLLDGRFPCPARGQLRAHGARRLLDGCRGIDRVGVGGRGLPVAGGLRAPGVCVSGGYLGVALVGFVLYGAATLQARVLPLWCAVPFIAALPAAIALVWIRPLLGLGEGASTTSILFGLAWLALGYALYSRGRESGELTSRVR